jgi:hypothetical protein
MKNVELKQLTKRLDGMSLDELDALADDAKAFKVAVAAAQRKKRGERGAGVLGVNGRITRL